jgi:type I restriction enzyme S subunit
MGSVEMKILPFLEVFEDVSAGNTKIKQADYLSAGTLPIVDQGQSLIGGYSNDQNSTCKADLPVVIFGDHTRVVKFIDFPFALGADGVKVLKNKCKADVKYLYYCLKNSKIPDTGYNRHFKFLKELKIPLPPLPIQKKIAAVLEKADELKRKREEQIKRLDDLLQATFLDMFGDPVTNPKGWDKKPVKFFADCIVPGRDKPKSFSGHIPWVTTDMLPKLGFIDIGRNCKGLSLAEISEVNAKIIPKNSVIMTCVGQLGLLAINKEPVVVNQQLHTFQCKREVVPEFLMYALSFETAYMNRMASSTTVPYMNKTICNSIPVIAPPKDKQERFKRFLGKILGQKEKKAKGHSEYENLFNSLMQRAFKGELDLK